MVGTSKSGDKSLPVLKTTGISFLILCSSLVLQKCCPFCILTWPSYCQYIQRYPTLSANSSSYKISEGTGDTGNTQTNMCYLQRVANTLWGICTGFPIHSTVIPYNYFSKGIPITSDTFAKGLKRATLLTCTRSILFLQILLKNIIFRNKKPSAADSFRTAHGFNFFFNAKNTHLLRIGYARHSTPPPPAGRGFETTLFYW